MKRLVFLLLALATLLLTGCGNAAPSADGAAETPAAPPPETAESAAPSVIRFPDGLEIPVPSEYRPLLIVETEPEAWNEHWTPLVSFFHKASVEAYAAEHPDGEGEGAGCICVLLRLDRIGFEDWLCGERIGLSLFAADEAECYYLLARPTDAGEYVPDADWDALDRWAAELPDQIVEANGLTSYDASDLFEADYTYGGSHVDLGYRFPGQPMDLAVLSLSQPVVQGAGGVWCVERVHYVYSDYGFTDTQFVFPVGFGVDQAAADYYAALQTECDAGEHAELLTPRGAALDYAKRTAWIFGEDVSGTDFELLESVG